MIKRRWLSILAKGDRKRQIQQQQNLQKQHQQREQLEQKDVEMEAAEALLHVHHSVAHAKEVLAQHAKKRVGYRRF